MDKDDENCGHFPQNDASTEDNVCDVISEISIMGPWENNFHSCGRENWKAHEVSHKPAIWSRYLDGRKCYHGEKKSTI